MSPVLLLVSIALSSADVGVVLTKRSGVSKSVAAARAKLVAQHLKVTNEVEDLTACQTRLPCLLMTARAHQWATLVTVETANVLGDAIIDVRLLSVDEDGRELARGNAQVSEANLEKALVDRLDAVKQALWPTAPSRVPEAQTISLPPPAREEPPLPPPLVATTQGAATVKPTARWVPLGVSLGVVVAAATCLGVSESMAERLRHGALSQPTIDQLVGAGPTFRTLGAVGLAVGGALTVASLILALAWPQSPLPLSAFWLPGGGGLAVGGTFR